MSFKAILAVCCLVVAGCASSNVPSTRTVLAGGAASAAPETTAEPAYRFVVESAMLELKTTPKLPTAAHLCEYVRAHMPKIYKSQTVRSCIMSAAAAFIDERFGPEFYRGKSDAQVREDVYQVMASIPIGTWVPIPVDFAFFLDWFVPRSNAYQSLLFEKTHAEAALEAYKAETKEALAEIDRLGLTSLEQARYLIALAQGMIERMDMELEAERARSAALHRSLEAARTGASSAERQ